MNGVDGHFDLSLMMYKVILMVLNMKIGYLMMLQGLFELSSFEVCVLNDFENL